MANRKVTSSSIRKDAKKSEQRIFYRVKPLKGPLPDPHEYGYENEYAFYAGLRRLDQLYRGRTGCCVDTRHVFVKLQFSDTPDGQPVFAWLPKFLVERTEPLVKEPEHKDPIADEIDSAFGF